MIQRRKRLDAVRQQLVDQPVVEIEALGIWRAGAFREDARPRNRETIGLGAQRLHQLDVFLVPMIMVGRGVAVAVVGDGPGRVGEAVPDRRAAAVLVDGALDLIGRGRGAPQKPARENRKRLSDRLTRRLDPAGRPASTFQEPTSQRSCQIGAGKILEWHRFTRLALGSRYAARRSSLLMHPALMQAGYRRFGAVQLCAWPNSAGRQRLSPP